MDIHSEDIINSAFDKQEFFETDLGTLSSIRHLKNNQGGFLTVIENPQNLHLEILVGFPIVVVNSDAPVLRRVIVIKGIRFEKDILEGSSDEKTG